MLQEKQRVLFLCTGNSCRSQMAEAWTRALHGGEIEAYSAGIESQGLNPFAVQVMAEVGVSMAQQRSKTLDALDGLPFDLVVTVCDHARESCPLLPAATRLIHVGFPDPPALARELPEGEARLNLYRQVRDQIRQFVLHLPAQISTKPADSNP